MVGMAVAANRRYESEPQTRFCFRPSHPTGDAFAAAQTLARCHRCNFIGSNHFFRRGPHLGCGAVASISRLRRVSRQRRPVPDSTVRSGRENLDS